jgi:O-antigen/teichoic acid export membrane protein
MDYSQVGIYSLGYKIAGVMNVFVVQAFALGFLPIAYKIQNSPDAQIFFKKVFKYFSMILVFGALGLSLFSREILLVFAQKPEFYIAYKIVPLITIAFIFKGIQYMFLLGFHYVKKTKYVAYIVTIALFVNIGLNFMLIPIFGIWGAALTTVISSLLISIISYFVSQKFYPVKYEIGKMLIVFVVGSALYLTSGLFADANIYFGIGLKIVYLFWNWSENCFVLIFPDLIIHLKILRKNRVR